MNERATEQHESFYDVSIIPSYHKLHLTHTTRDAHNTATFKKLKQVPMYGYSCVISVISALREDKVQSTAGIFITTGIFFKFLIRKNDVRRVHITDDSSGYYETWSCTLRKEHRRWGFENRVLKRIFGPRRDEVRGE